MSKHEKVSEKLVGWLASFADQMGNKIVKDNNLTPEELKNANHLENILDIVKRNKKISVDDKVAQYRQLVGLDLMDSLEKEGNGNMPNKEAHTKKLSRMPLSIRDKIAQNISMDQQQIMDKVRQYVEQVIKNRNGAIATPAILEQLEDYIKVDKDWLREHYSEIESIVENARKAFFPQSYHNAPINDFARTDDPQKSDKEAPLFLPPTPSPNT